LSILPIPEHVGGTTTTELDWDEEAGGVIIAELDCPVLETLLILDVTLLVVPTELVDDAALDTGVDDTLEEEDEEVVGAIHCPFTPGIVAMTSHVLGGIHRVQVNAGPRDILVIYQ
jgi:hypothetical protein